MKKITIKIALLMLTLTMVMMCVSPLVGVAVEGKAVNIRIEGINSTVISTPTGYTTTAITAWDAVKELMDNNSIPYTHGINQDWGSVYISSINGEAEGRFSGAGGWLYIVNGEMPWEGSANYYNVKSNDEIVFYYGDMAPNTLVPKITVPSSVRAGEQFEIALQGEYDEWYYDNGWKSSHIVAKIQDVNVAFNGGSYTTNADGKVTLTAPVKAGNYDLSISKYAQSGMPAILRGTVKVNVLNALELGNFGFLQNSENVNKLVQGEIVCSVSVQNYSSKSIVPRLIFAVYNGTKIQKIAVSTLEESVISAGGTGILNARVNIADVAGSYAKAFVVEDLQGMKPLGMATIIDENGVR